jgi:hypothetical protein
VIFFVVVFLPLEVRAVEDRSFYSKYRFTGLVEINYYDYSFKTTANGQKSEIDSKVLEEILRLGVSGYIVHPKLVVYSAAIFFRHAMTKEHGDEVDSKLTEKDIGYNLSLTLLRRRPYTLDLYASRDTATVSGDMGSYDSTTNNYGATLRLFLKDLPFLKRGGGGEAGKTNGNGHEELPLLTLHYNHSDFSSNIWSGKQNTDSLGLDLIGAVKAIRTTYTLTYEFVKYTNPGTSYDSQSIRMSTDTLLKKNAILSTTFQYITAADTRVINFWADLELTPTERFSHVYTYGFSSYEIGSDRTDYHVGTGQWNYRFTPEFTGRGTAYYSITKTDIERDDAYGTGVSLSYHKPIKDLAFSANYAAAYEQRTGGIFENSLDLGLRTTKLKWGVIYANYDISYVKRWDQGISGQGISDQGTFIDQIARLGVRGRGPGRAYWTLEGEYGNVKNDLGGVSANFAGGADTLTIIGATRTSYYSGSAEAGYPFSNWGLATLKSYYAYGWTDSKSFSSYYSEARFNYQIWKNLGFMAWWRAGQNKIQADAFAIKTTEYEASLYYRLRRLYLALEYRRWKTEEGPQTTDAGRIYLRLVRPI